MAKSKNYGILCIILSAFCFACMNLFVKKAGNLPSFEKSFFRNIIAFFFAFGVIVKSKEKVNIPKEALPALFMRSIGGTVGILCNFYAIDHLVIADASMLNKLSPFFVLIFSYLILKEKVKLYQGICIIVAFIGSLFVIKPDKQDRVQVDRQSALTQQAQAEGCAVLLPEHQQDKDAHIAHQRHADIAYTFVRIAGKKGVKSPVIVAFFSGFSSLVTLPLMIMDFEPMTAAQLMFLILAGLAATGGQFGITLAYTFAPAREISVYDYSQIIFATILGILFLGELPDKYSFVGYGIIISASLVMFILNNRKTTSA